MANPLSLFPARIRFVNADGTLTPEAYRSLQGLLERVGGPVAPGIGDLDAQQLASTGAPELRAELVAAIDGLASVPAIEPLQIDALLSEIHGLRETVARLASKINDLEQGNL